MSLNASASSPTSGCVAVGDPLARAPSGRRGASARSGARSGANTRRSRTTLRPISTEDADGQYDRLDQAQIRAHRRRRERQRQRGQHQHARVDRRTRARTASCRQDDAAPPRLDGQQCPSRACRRRRHLRRCRQRTRTTTSRTSTRDRRDGGQPQLGLAPRPAVVARVLNGHRPVGIARMVVTVSHVAAQRVDQGLGVAGAALRLGGWCGCRSAHRASFGVDCQPAPADGGGQTNATSMPPRGQVLHGERAPSQAEPKRARRPAAAPCPSLGAMACGAAAARCAGTIITGTVASRSTERAQRVKRVAAPRSRPMRPDDDQSRALGRTEPRAGDPQLGAECASELCGGGQSRWSSARATSSSPSPSRPALDMAAAGTSTTGHGDRVTAAARHAADRRRLRAGFGARAEHHHGRGLLGRDQREPHRRRAVLEPRLARRAPGSAERLVDHTARARLGEKLGRASRPPRARGNVDREQTQLEPPGERGGETRGSATGSGAVDAAHDAARRTGVELGQRSRRSRRSARALNRCRGERPGARLWAADDRARPVAREVARDRAQQRRPSVRRAAAGRARSAPPAPPDTAASSCCAGRPRRSRTSQRSRSAG